MGMGNGEGSTVRNFIVFTVHLIVRVIKSKRLWAGNIAIMEKGRSDCKILQVNLQERALYEGLGVDGRTTLEWNLKKWVSVRGIRLIR